MFCRVSKKQEENSMKNFKKITASLLALVLVFGLVACNNTDNGDQTDDPDTNVEEPGEEDNTLSVWAWDPAFNLYAMEEAEKIYKETNPNFALNIIETPWDDVQTKLTTMASSQQLDELPDIFLMQDNAFQKNVINFPEVFTDLTGSDIAFDEFGEAKLAFSIVDGKNYGVPFDSGTAVAAYRTDLLAEAGLSIADYTDITWADFVENGKLVREATGKSTTSATADPDLMMIMLHSAGASLFDEEGNPHIAGNEVVLEAFNVYQDLVGEGVVLIVNDWDQYVGSIVDTTVAGVIDGAWILASVQTAEDQSGLWEITNVPKLEIPGGTNYSNSGGSSWAVTTSGSNPDLAIDFLSKTFADSIDLYETILPSSGAIATWLPAGDSDVYGVPQDFFGGQAIYAEITEYSKHVPSSNTGVYYYEARDAVGTALTNALNGADIETELQGAQETVEFLMGG